MGKTTRKLVAVFFLAVILFAAGNVFGADEGSPKSLIPENVTIAEGFEPGIGEPVGKILMVNGEAVIIHADASRAYRVRKDLPLYNSDAVVTRAKARLRISLNDGSMTTLAADTRLIISKSDYDPEKKDRSAFLGMEAGKARFWAVKMKDFKNSEFKVKTKTAVAGVRGSDFVIIASDVLTEVTTLKDTTLDLISLAQPDAEPVLLSDFMRSRVGEGKLPTAAEKVQMEEIERLMKEFLFAGETYDPDQMVKSQGKPVEGAAAKGSEKAQSGGGVLAGLAAQGILLPIDELYRPDLTDMQRLLEGFRVLDMISLSDFSRIENDSRNQQTDFSQVVRENEAARPDYEQLPGPVEGP
jgi:hypothetical protein